MATMQSIDQFHRTRTGKLTFGGVEIALAIIFGIFAVDSGMIWQHLLTIILFIGGLRNLVNAFHSPKLKKSQ